MDRSSTKPSLSALGPRKITTTTGTDHLVRMQRISRPRLSDRFARAMERRITLVIAPAGFGKTTAVLEALATRENCVFLKTPEGIKTLSEFVVAFAELFASQFPSMPHAPEEPTRTSDADQHHFALYYSWALTHLRNQNCTLAFDDLHRADHLPIIATFLVKLAESCGDGIRWIFSSRTQGHLPTTKWQAYDLADEAITAVDLRMSVEEANALAQLVGSLASPDDIRNWVHETNGFPIPLVYAIRRHKAGAATVKLPTSAMNFAFNFLADELWSSLTERERRLLEIISLLDPIEIYDFEQLEIENAASTLIRLCRDITFIQLDELRKITMHDLFKDFVQHQLSLRSRSSRTSRFSEAAELQFKLGQHAHGFRTLISLKEPSILAQAIETHYVQQLPNFAFVGEMINAISSIDVDALGYRALALQSEYYTWVGNFHESLRYAEQILNRDNVPSNYVMAAIRSIGKRMNNPDAPEQSSWPLRIDNLLARLEAEDVLHARSYQLMFLSRVSEKASEALTLLQSIRSSSRDSPPQLRLDLDIQMAVACLHLMEYDEAKRICREAISIASGLQDKRSQAVAINLLGIALINSFDQGIEALFDVAREAVQSLGLWRMSQISHWAPARYFALKGDLTTAVTNLTLHESVVLYDQNELDNFQSIERISRLLCALLNSDYQAISSDFTKNGVPDNGENAYEILAINSVSCVLSKRFDQARKLLEAAWPLRESLSADQLHRASNAKSFEIIALIVIGNLEQINFMIAELESASDCFRDLCTALRYLADPAPAGLRRPFASDSLNRPYIGLSMALIERALDLDTNRSRSPILTTAEIDVLKLLELGKTNKEIAQIRKRSSETIKQQVTSIFRKLNADNRTSAVKRAKDQGVI